MLDAGDRTVTQTGLVAAGSNFSPLGEAGGFTSHHETVLNPGWRSSQSGPDTSECCRNRGWGWGSAGEGFLEEEMSGSGHDLRIHELGPEGRVTQGWSGRCSRQKQPEVG